MLIFSVDTSGRLGSIALCHVTADSLDVVEIARLSGGSYSACLIPELSAMLARHGLRKQDLEGFSVISGPGSFTGLRVGLAAVKGLAEILHRPIAAVSMLEAIAAQAQSGSRVIAAFDAGRKEVYTGEYDLQAGRPVTVHELLLDQAAFRALLAAKDDTELVTPDPHIVELAPEQVTVRQIEWPDASEISRLGYCRIEAGETVAPENLEANYIRRSDAEIFSHARNHG